MTKAHETGRGETLERRCLAVALASALAAVSLSACLQDPPNPFDPKQPDGSTGGAGGDAGSDGGGPPNDDPTLGGPCVDDDQCDDQLDCTADRCDLEVDRCRFTPDSFTCQNGVHCDGTEVCDNKLGCRPGAPQSCSDDNFCTIDTCLEASQSCENVPRDADGDLDPDNHCGGGDCDDDDASVSSLRPEVCANAKDDDCDGQVDEPGCTTPDHDTCSDPLSIQGAGSYLLDTTGATLDYPSACGLAGSSGDVVASITLPPGLQDIEVTARAQGADVVVAIAQQCGDPLTELTCGNSFSAAQGGKIAKAKARSIGDPAAASTLAITTATSPGSEVVLEVEISPASTEPSHETCGTALALTTGSPVTAELIDADEDLATACAHATGELVYAFTLDDPKDIDIFAISLDGDGVPSISLRDPDCALPEDEITCQTTPIAHVFRHSLPAGTYYVAVTATAPTDVSVTLEVSAPTTAPDDDSCLGAPTLAPNTTVALPMDNHQDDVDLGCLPGAIDAVYTLDLATDSDVLVVQRFSSGDSAAALLTLPGCAAPADLLTCATGSPSPIRAAAHDVPAGSYRVVAESLLGQPQELTAFVRPAAVPTLVPFADGCADVFEIPPSGGLFQGNTTNATADFTAGCDVGLGEPGGAKDQLLKLELTAPKRVVFDMLGSAYSTMLSVRSGATCPGAELPQSCSLGFSASRSFLDLDLIPGTYYVQIDGYAGSVGPWFLDVRVVDP